jgi:hypothetical protein
MAIGSLIIREKQKISDEETIEQICENPYLQWFIGLNEFTDKAPFDKSSMTYFRKRVTPEMLSLVNDYITGRKPSGRNKGGPGGGGSAIRESEAESGSQNKGTVILDATCVPADIKYPTDVNLLNESREKLENMIRLLHRQAEAGKKAPRAYKKNGRKAYLRFARNRNPKKSEIRLAIKKQLGYVRRDLRIIAGQIAAGGLLTKKQTEELRTIEKVYKQQDEMYRSGTHQASDRIVSIRQNWVRPIVRGKATAAVEFGAKVSISMTDGYAFIEKLSWDAYNESRTLIETIENYREKTGLYPERILADKIYRTRENLGYCKEHGIRMNGPKLGRPYQDKKLYREQCIQEKLEAGERNEVEGKFGEGKRRYYLQRTMTRLKETTGTQIYLTFLVMNLSKKLRASLYSILKTIRNVGIAGFFKEKALAVAIA